MIELNIFYCDRLQIAAMITFNHKVIAQVAWWEATCLQSVAVHFGLTAITVRQTYKSLLIIGI